jgi:hypothetical protein
VRCFLLNFVRPVPMQPPSSKPAAMNFPFHLFRLESAPTRRDSEIVHVAGRADVQWDQPVFRAPTLPTPRQFSSDLPCFVNFRSKLPPRV